MAGRIPWTNPQKQNAEDITQQADAFIEVSCALPVQVAQKNTIAFSVNRRIVWHRDASRMKKYTNSSMVCAFKI